MLNPRISHQPDVHPFWAEHRPGLVRRFPILQDLGKVLGAKKLGWCSQESPQKELWLQALHLAYFHQWALALQGQFQEHRYSFYDFWLKINVNFINGKTDAFY